VKANSLGIVALFLTGIAALSPANGAEDLSTELPRIAPVAPQDAMGLFAVKNGFRIDLVAAEPLTADPIALDFDEHGRLFVVEMRGYSENAEDHLGVIRLLTDSDGDGRIDRSTIYVDKLAWPTAVLCYDGGVFVGVAPDILYCKDADDDGRADLIQKVFTGFGTSNVQGLINSFRWGIDNRIHGATSSSGGQVRRDGQPVEEAITLRGRDFSFDPRTLDLRAESGGGQHGMCFDRWGNKFVCSNSDHLQAVLIPDRYVANNPYYALTKVRESIATDGPQAAVFRTSPVEPWRIVRTRLRVAGTVPGPVEGGGTPAGYFTSATGVTIYEGDAWPLVGHGTTAIVGDVGSNVIHRKHLTQAGVGFRGERIDTKSEFIASRDIWFRPVQFAHGPDGALYVADMYREVIEHPDSLPPVIKRHLDLTSGRDRGRIYRIVPSSFAFTKRALPGDATTAELVELLAHANVWHRTTAARLLCERRDLTCVSLLNDMANDTSRPPEGRVHALFVLRSLGKLPEATVIAALRDEDPHVRQCGLKVSEALGPPNELMRMNLEDLASDADQRVRFQLALTLSECRVADDPELADWKSRMIAKLIQHQPSDPWLQRACLIASGDIASQVRQRVAAIPDLTDSRVNELLLKSLAEIASEHKRDGGRALQEKQLLASLIAETPLRQPPLHQDVIRRYTDALTDRGSATTGRTLFEKHCKTCHNQQADGKSLGPNLANLRSRGAQIIVTNVLDPNREVHPQYISYTAEMDDGRLISGVIAAETATSVTLSRDLEHSETMLKTHIASLQSTGKSLMPDNFAVELTPVQMNDIVTYIISVP
jgi:putative membrane-bound dehydrogenase-like protein